jgi:hypothetical protein
MPVTVEFPMPSKQKRPTARHGEPARKRPKARTVLLVVALWTAIIVVLNFTFPHKTGETTERIAAARSEGPSLFESLAPLPDAKPLGPMTEEVLHLRHGGARLKYSRRFSATGNVSDAVGWYRRQLEPMGWRLTASNPSVKVFEKDPWSFEIQIDSVYEWSPPAYNFRVRLVWNN